MDKTIYPLPGGESIAKSGQFSGKVAFSNAVKVTGGTTLFISGQLAFDKQLNLVGKGDMKAQTRQVLANIKAAVEAAGGNSRDIVMVKVYVTDFTHFRDVHDERLEFFAADNLPASTLVKVAGLVHPDALIEIDAVAVLP